MKARLANAPGPMVEEKPAPLPPATRLDWLRLIRAEGIGHAAFWELLDEFGTAEAALEAITSRTRAGARRMIPSRAECEDEIAEAARHGAVLVAAVEPEYAPLLARADVPPPLLYQKGEPGLWRRPVIAIVGSRDASTAGQRFAADLARDLGAAGFVVVSGLARGIDGAAHRAALSTGTVAVTGGGIDVIYPPQHASLHAEIAAAGLIVTECPPGFRPRAQDFPRRNRIISGCSLGVIVVEANIRSGSLITARIAAEQGREVFAVPGHPLDPRAEGPNSLLKRGAALVTGAEDVIAALESALQDWPGYLDQAGRMAEPVRTPAGRTGGPRGQGVVRLRDLRPHGDEGSPDRQGITASAFAPEEPEIAAAVSGDPEEMEPDAPGSPRDIVQSALQTAPVSVDDIIRTTGLDARTVAVALVELEMAGLVHRSGQQLVALKSPRGS